MNDELKPETQIIINQLKMNALLTIQLRSIERTLIDIQSTLNSIYKVLPRE